MLYNSRSPSSLHSFPTRRSSDLWDRIKVGDVVLFGCGPGQTEGYWDSVVTGISKDGQTLTDRKSTRLNSSHRCISYAVFCLKKKKTSYGVRFGRITVRV